MKYDMRLKPKLLVFIPTYQRPAALNRQLAAIEHLRKNNQGIEIFVLVSQNESIEKFALFSAIDGVSYRGNPVNLGADINIALGYVLCDGYDFLWILSDDDFLRSESETPKLPLDKEFDLLVFDKTSGSRTEKRQITAADMIQSPMGLISNVIYRVNSIEESIHEAILNVCSCFPHLAVIAREFSNRECIIHYHDYNKVFIADDSYSAECITDYSAARSGILRIAKYFKKSERRKFVLSYLRYSDLSKLKWFGEKASLSEVIREVTFLYPLAAPGVIAVYILRKIRNKF